MWLDTVEMANSIEVGNLIPLENGDCGCLELVFLYSILQNSQDLGCYSPVKVLHTEGAILSPVVIMCG